MKTYRFYIEATKRTAEVKTANPLVIDMIEGAIQEYPMDTKWHAHVVTNEFLFEAIKEQIKEAVRTE